MAKKKKKLGKYGRAVKKYIGKGASASQKKKWAASTKKTANMKRILRKGRKG